MDKKDFYETPLDRLTLEDLEQSIDKIGVSSDSIFSFHIVTKYGYLSNIKNAPLLSMVRWNGYERLDLRRWKEDGTPAKGITFSEDEVEILVSSLSALDTKIKYKNTQHEYRQGKAHAKILMNIATLSTTGYNGLIWKKQVNIVDWGYGQKVDIRKWTEDYDKCGKGICISFEETERLVEILKSI